MLHLLLVLSLVSGAGAGPMIGELVHLIRSIEKRAMVTSITDSLAHSLGLRADAASSTGSLHAKVKDLKDNPATAINSIQRGGINVANASSATATITSVSTAKSMLQNLGTQGAAGTSGRWGVQLTNATTVTAWQGNGGGTAVDIGYEVVEFK